MKIKLDETQRNLGARIISVFSSYSKICFRKIIDDDFTFKEILTEAEYDFNDPHPTFIIIEGPLHGKVYIIGNGSNADEDNYIWEHGYTNGYA